MDIVHSTIAVNDIRIHSTFDTLFPRRPHVLDALKLHIQEHGFDSSFPVILAYGPWIQHDVLLDGHSRHQVCSELGLKEVPAVRRYFETEELAIEYMVHLQRDRRNLSDAEILSCIQALDTKKKAGRPTKQAQSCANSQRGKSAAQLASTLGISTRKLEMARTISEHGDETIKEGVNSNKLSISKAYQEVQMKRGAEKHGSGSVTEDTSAVGDPRAFGAEEDEGIDAHVEAADEDHDDRETDDSALDSSVAQIGVPTGASDARNDWALEVIAAFDSGCIDYLIIGQGTPPEGVTEHQQVFVAPSIAPGPIEAVNTATGETPQADSTTWSGPVDLRHDAAGWELLEKSWVKHLPDSVVEPPDGAAIESGIQEPTVEGTPLLMTQLPADANNLTQTSEQPVESDPVLDPRIAQILDLKATDATSMVTKFLIQNGLGRIGGMSSILIDRERLLAHLIKREANSLEGFSRLLAEFKASPWVDVLTDEDLTIDIHGYISEYPYGACWFWERCSTKDESGFLWREGGFRAKVADFMAEHGLKSLNDIVRKVASMDEELRPRRSGSESSSPEVSVAMTGDLSGAIQGHEHRSFACATR